MCMKPIMYTEKNNFLLLISMQKYNTAGGGGDGHIFSLKECRNVYTERGRGVKYQTNQTKP